MNENKRTGNLKEFISALIRHLKSIKPDIGPRRIIRIDAPEPDGDITVVIHRIQSNTLNAVTYRADGTWSGLSYWCEDQI